MKNRSLRRRTSREDSDENLRGKLRELQKQLEAERRYSSSLEKKLKSIASNGSRNEEIEVQLNPVCCQSCGKSESIKIVEIWRPGGGIKWLTCELCGHKQKV